MTAKSNAREGDGVAVPLPEPSCHWSPPGGTYGALYTTAELRAYGDAREAAAMQAQQGAEPDGFVLVPREPTEMMKSRGAYVVSGVTREGAAATWAAMVAEAQSTGAPR